MTEDMCAQLAADSHAGPFRFCSRADAEAVAGILTRAKNAYFARDRLFRVLKQDRGVLDDWRWGRGRWMKGMFAADALTYDVGVAEPIVARVRAALGEDLLLCGAILINQRPGDAHAWHVDREQRRWGGLNVWLALRNVTADSALKIIPGSHAYRTSLATLLEEGAVDAADEAAVLAAARRFDPSARVHTIRPEPGGFVLFDGLAWHSSANGTDRRRSALLLQYCPSDREVTVPRQHGAAWGWDGPPAPCALASGRDRSGANWLVPRPWGARRLTFSSRWSEAARANSRDGLVL